MEKIQIRKVFNKAILLLLMLVFGEFYSNMPPGGGAGGVGPGRPKTPIDMYEGILVGIAVVLIIGYYFYSKNKRVANS